MSLIGDQAQVNVFLEPTSNNTSAVSGIITDNNGIAVEGADVTLESDIIPALQTTSASDGSFRFENLPAGKYAVIFTKKGYRDLKREQIELLAGGNVQVDVQLVTKPEPEKGTASGRSSAGISWTYSAEELRMLPKGDSIYAILDHTPAVEIDTFSTVHSDPGLIDEYADIAVRGADFYSNLWNYDGLNISVPDRVFSPFQNVGVRDYAGDFPSFFDLENVDEVQIITAGNDISLASPGLAINVVSKQGGREWHGAGYFYYSDHHLQSNNTPEEVKNGPRLFASETFLMKDSQEYGFNLGGPVIQDKLFIWGAFHQGWLDRFNLVDNLEENKSTSYSLKANWNPLSAHQFQFSYFKADHRYRQTISEGRKEEELQATQTIFPGIWSTRYSWIPNDGALVQAGYGYVGAGFQHASRRRYEPELGYAKG